MKVLVIGNGGREHALAWKLKQSPRVAEVIVAPGNAGTARERGVRNADVAVTDLDGLLKLARDEKVELTVVGPEVPLVAGVVDKFRNAGLRIYGPRAIAAQLEGSKAFAKDFLLRHNIPTARYAVFTELNPALAYVRQHGAPIVIKADGLAAGKGVVVALTLADAELALHDMLGAHAFGDASARVVILFCRGLSYLHRTALNLPARRGPGGAVRRHPVAECRLARSHEGDRGGCAQDTRRNGRRAGRHHGCRVQHPSVDEFAKRRHGGRGAEAVG